MRHCGSRGVGFALAGLCPGTSCVAAASGRADGAATVGGFFAGVLATGALLPAIDRFYRSTPRGVDTLPARLGVPEGIAVLGVVAGLAQRVLVMYGGFIIEESPVRELYANPEHPYTIGLLGSLPRVDEKERAKLFSIEGQPPVLYQKPTACPFAPRCKWALEHCWNENPPLLEVGPDHRAACWVDTRTGRHR